MPEATTPAYDAEPTPEVREFDGVLRTAFLDTGGFEPVMRAEADPAVRLREVEPLLDSLGVLDLDPAAGEDQLQAAAVATRAAGLYALPFPLAERLAGNAFGSGGGRPVALTAVDGDRPWVNHGDLPFDWRAVDVASGRVAALRPGTATGGRMGPFVTAAETGEPVPGGLPAALPLALLLQSFTLLGMLEGALDLTRDHVNDRVQFGTPIVNFQAVQHQLADALIAIELFEQQAHYALWSLARGRPRVLVDVVGARLTGLRSADKVLRVGHQLHGATGFADESAISWLSRHSQPLRRLPAGPARTEVWFAGLVTAHGFDGLFTTGAPGAGPRSGHAANGTARAGGRERIVAGTGGPVR